MLVRHANDVVATVVSVGRAAVAADWALLTGQDEMMLKYGRPFMRLGWWELHQILAAAQPEGSVVFDSKFAGCPCRCWALPGLLACVPALTFAAVIVSYKLHLPN